MDTTKDKKDREPLFPAPAKKMSLLLAAIAALGLASSWLIPDGYFQAAMENDLIRSLHRKMDAYNKHLPEDRLYLQTDKPFYEPGDDIWLSAFIRDGLSLKPSEKSDIVYVELINPKGAVEKTINIIAKNGKAAGDFTLDKEAVGGLYKLKAYTNWMKNSGTDNCFVKEIQVQDLVLPALKMKLDFEKKAFGAGDDVIAKVVLNSNENKPLSNFAIRSVATLNGAKLIEQSYTTDEEGVAYLKFKLPAKLAGNDGLLNVMIDYNGSTESISRSIPIVLNAVKFTMFPEGGDLVYGLESKVAFRALNEFGKPADVEGTLYTEKGSKVVSFSSFHQGMGAFKFNPQNGERYFVKLTKPAGIEDEFKVQEPLNMGYVLSVDNSKDGEVGVQVTTTEKEELSLLAQVRGKSYYATIITALPGANTLRFSTEKFPIGVVQITLFDAKGIARAERLAFVNRDKHMSVSVETEKEKFLPREKIKMTVVVKDERGMPMPANLSMAVVNDQLLSFADDRSGNIFSQLLLQQDLNGKIEEPAFYFNEKESKSLQALDYLMMTSGWRRFTWEKLVEEELPPINFLGQKAIVAGTILDAATQKPIAYAKLKSSSGTDYTADANGKFFISRLDLSTPHSLTIMAPGFNSQTQYLQDYNQDLEYYLYKPDRYPPAMTSGAVFERVEDEGHLQNEAPGMDHLVMAQEAPLLKAIVIEKAVKQDNKAQALPKKEVRAGQAAGEILADKKRVDRVARKFMEKEWARDDQAVPPVNVYYRARQFAAPSYEKPANVETRTDFRNTIYWNPNLEVGYSGRKTIEFFASDDIASFRATVEGIASDGSIGRAEKTIFTQLPFSMQAKIPVEVVTEDLLSIPLTLKNNTGAPLGGLLSITAPEGLQQVGTPELVQTIMPGKTKTVYLNYKVLDKIGEGDWSIAFKSCGLSDAFTQKIKIAPKGFPQQLSFSAQEPEKEYSFAIKNCVNGSLKASFTAFPNVVSDLMKGVEGILQEPYGCFEQTSCTAYPNAMVLDYLKSTDSKDLKTLARATDLLNRGYKRLTGFETPGKGYEWFGANPAHEGLTAYGIMEFVDMQKAGQEIDQKMLDRTAQWLLNHRDGKGGFEREQRALHDFGRISNDVLNGYIVYALAEAGYTDIQKEFEATFEKALSTKDPYLLAMTANAASALQKRAKADQALSLLLSAQAKDGSFNGTTHSITYSQGNSLTIETTALSIMALLKTGKDPKALQDAVQYLISARSGSGVFSSTQGTILALKALTEFAKFSKRTTEDGVIMIYIDHKKVAERAYKAGDKGAITIDSLEQFVKGEGLHTLKVKYKDAKTPLPYALAIRWNTFLPQSDKECSVDLSTQLAAKTAAVGETVRLSTILTNKKNEEIPSTMAIIGIPAGFTAQAWQLKELQEKNVFDYYEMKGNNIAVYYRGLPAKAIRTIHLDLKAEIPGTYDAPPSSAYLYYTNEFKTWCATEKITIRKAGEL